jgi:CheY-like chemotaxis protein
LDNFVQKKNYIIAFTTNSECKEKCLNNGFDLFIEKPIKRIDLEKFIQNLYFCVIKNKNSLVKKL